MVQRCIDSYHQVLSIFSALLKNYTLTKSQFCKNNENDKNNFKFQEDPLLFRGEEVLGKFSYDEQK